MSRQKYNSIKPQLNRDAISAQGGFTLIELLVAAAGGLILMGFMAVVFGFYGRTVRENQAIIRMNDALRSASYKLRQDLQGVTCDVTPWQKPEADAGYFELIEGPLTDSTYYDSIGAIASRLPTDAEPNNLLGDYDDVLLFTTRGNGDSFVGKMNTTDNGSRCGGSCLVLCSAARPCRWDESLLATSQATAGSWVRWGWQFFTFHRRRNQLRIPRQYPPYFRNTIFHSGKKAISCWRTV